MSQTENGFTELTKELVESIDHQMNWLHSIKMEITAGTYNAEQARNDYENATNNEGFNWLSLLQDMGDTE
jgi:hypothetical protein